MIKEFSGYLKHNLLKSTQKYAVCYASEDKSINFGLIKFFIQMGDNFFCILRVLSKKKNFCNDNILESFCDKYFIISELSNIYKNINFCVKMCYDLSEHE